MPLLPFLHGIIWGGFCKLLRRFWTNQAHRDNTPYTSSCTSPFSLILPRTTSQINDLHGSPCFGVCFLYCFVLFWWGRWDSSQGSPCTLPPRLPLFFCIAIQLFPILVSRLSKHSTFTCLTFQPIFERIVVKVYQILSRARGKVFLFCFCFFSVYSYRKKNCKDLCYNVNNYLKMEGWVV